MPCELNDLRALNREQEQHRNPTSTSVCRELMSLSSCVMWWSTRSEAMMDSASFSSPHCMSTLWLLDTSLWTAASCKPGDLVSGVPARSAQLAAAIGVPAGRQAERQQRGAPGRPHQPGLPACA